MQIDRLDRANLEGVSAVSLGALNSDLELMNIGLSDPRQYAHVYPQSNMILNEAVRVNSGEQTFAELVAIVDKFLKSENDTLINVALNLSPSYEITAIIWDALNKAINNAQNGANIFAIPIVFVVGSKSTQRLSAQVDIDRLNQFCIDKHIFMPGGDAFISGKLVDSATIAQIKPSQLYYWVRNLNKAKLWLPIEVNGTGIEVRNEGVFLRFLVGVSMAGSNENNQLNLNAFQQNSVELMRLIHACLDTSGVTLCPLPFTPTNLFEAYAVGDAYRKDVAIQVSTSNIVRTIRQKQQTPSAIITTEASAIRLDVFSMENLALAETSLWHLEKTDNFDKALATITQLLEDMQIKWSFSE